MRSSCCLLVFALLSSCSFVAKADPIDFKGNILDPPSANDDTFPQHIERSDAFSITFDACQAGELPGGNTGDGCFAVSNRSGDTWTSFTLTIPNTSVLNSQVSQCNTDTTALAYTSVGSCGLDPSGNEYILNFTNGSFPSDTSNTLFFVESGVPYDEFPTFQAVAGTSVTPEPSSLLLLGTGLFGMTFLCRRQARRA